MSAQPKRAPESEPKPKPEQETPRLRSRNRPRLSTHADRPASEEVSKLHARLKQAFGPAAEPRGQLTDLLLKLLTVAAACVVVAEAMARNAPALGRLLG